MLILQAKVGGRTRPVGQATRQVLLFIWVLGRLAAGGP